MKYFLIVVVTASIFSFVACATKKGELNSTSDHFNDRQKEAFVYYFKVQSFCSCYKHSFKESNILEIMSKEDLLGSYDVLANPVILKKIDSLGKAVSNTILPSTYLDFENKRRITAKCLDFYASTELDSIAKSAYRD